MTFNAGMDRLSGSIGATGTHNLRSYLVQQSLSTTSGATNDLVRIYLNEVHSIDIAGFNDMVSQYGSQ